MFEPQTGRLCGVCRIRNVPIITVVNKVDREGKEPFALLDESADVRSLDVAPMRGPAGMGGTFKGIYDLRRNRLFQRAPDATGAYEGGKADLSGLDDPRLEELVTPEIAAHVRDEAELAMAGYAAFDAAAYRHGDLTPVFFGSALKDFGVEQLIDALAEFAPPPREQPATPRVVEPGDPAVSGFIFKVQANMNQIGRAHV